VAARAAQQPRAAVNPDHAEGENGRQRVLETPRLRRLENTLESVMAAGERVGDLCVGRALRWLRSLLKRRSHWSNARSRGC